MAASLFKTVAVVGVSALIAFWLTCAFDVWYANCQRRRRVKWEQKHGRHYE